MSRLTDIGVESTDQILLAAEEGSGSRVDDRSLGAVMREIAKSLVGWLFFVVAVQLLLHGTHFI